MKRIALLGMPNTGKSTLFNRLTGSSARVANWAGVTVDLSSAKILLGGHIAEMVDLPGIYDLHGFSDDEKVVRHLLEGHPIDLLAIVVNATQIERQLPLVLQVRSLGLPAVLLLNMADEAKRNGVEVDCARLAAHLGMPVVLLSAKYGLGQVEAMRVLAQALADASDVGPARRAQLQAVLSDDVRIEQETAAMMAEAVTLPLQLPEQVSDRIDRLALHPWLGLPLFFLAMLLLFQAVFWIGGPLQQGLTWLFDQLRQLALEPVAAQLPDFFHGLLLDGVYAGFVTVAAFVPLIVLFFFFMALVEDSGYLARAAFLTDALMAKLGLDGRSFVMVLMGFGCNVPAVMGTRMMRARPLRLLSMLVIPLSLCSARLQVFLFIVSAIFAPMQAPWVIFGFYLASFLTMIVTALLFRGRFKSSEPFVVELPPWRVPTLRQVAMRGWLEVRHFLSRATRFIVLGVIAIWLLTNLPLGAAPGSTDTLAGQLGTLFVPVLAPIGIDEKLAIALMFGFVAKEVMIGAFAVIYGMSGDALSQEFARSMDWVQAVSFMLFTLIYTPCISTIATIKTESKSAAFATLAVLWPLALAWLTSFVFYQGMRQILA
ncbi:MAG: ferrous iron transport protein B [Betaproteobacteria bacterium]|nr:ferrous iron transport protein B [Betaproteobacteria bacterium]